MRKDGRYPQLEVPSWPPSWLSLVGNERLLEGQPVERGGTVHLQLKRTREMELFCQEFVDFEERATFFFKFIGCY